MWLPIVPGGGTARRHETDRLLPKAASQETSHRTAAQDRSTIVFWRLRYGLDDPGFESWPAQETFLFSRNVQTDYAAHPASCSICTDVPSSGIKRPRREVDHSPPSSADVKDQWSYNLILLYAFAAHKGNLYLYPFLWLPISCLSLISLIP